MKYKIIRLESGNQRLQLVPALGGGIADWDWKSVHGWTPLLRPWDGVSEDPYNLACFPVVPWVHRISGGRFEHAGIGYSIAPNRDDETAPVHGDGWLQPWEVSGQSEQSVSLVLESHQFGGNPWEYRCVQIFTLLPDSLAVEISVTHLGKTPLPYGLGLLPYFMWNQLTRLRFKADGAWLVNSDGMLTAHSQMLPLTWDYNQPEPLDGPLINNCYSGWDGEAAIAYPDRDLTLTMHVENNSGHVLLYRPGGADYFGLAPITHPADAYHLPDRPGVATLSSGQSLSLKMQLQVLSTG